jgi:hypothetical protein
MPYQLNAALLVAAASIIITLGLFFFSTRFEKKHQANKHDDH